MDLNTKFELEFKAYLEDAAKLSESSIDNQIKYLKSLCAKLKKIGIDYNKSVESFERISLDNEIVYLTLQELMDLSMAKLDSKSLSEQKRCLRVQLLFRF